MTNYNLPTVQSRASKRYFVIGLIVGIVFGMVIGGVISQLHLDMSKIFIDGRVKVKQIPDSILSDCAGYDHYRCEENWTYYLHSDNPDTRHLAEVQVMVNNLNCKDLISWRESNPDSWIAPYASGRIMDMHCFEVVP